MKTFDEIFANYKGFQGACNAMNDRVQDLIENKNNLIKKYSKFRHNYWKQLAKIIFTISYSSLDEKLEELDFIKSQKNIILNEILNVTRIEDFLQTDLNSIKNNFDSLVEAYCSQFYIEKMSLYEFKDKYDLNIEKINFAGYKDGITIEKKIDIFPIVNSLNSLTPLAILREEVYWDSRIALNSLINNKIIGIINVKESEIIKTSLDRFTRKIIYQGIPIRLK